MLTALHVPSHESALISCTTNTDTFSLFILTASLITTSPQAMHTEAVGAGDTGAVLAGDGATHAMQSDAAVTTIATTTGNGVQAKAASPISAATRDTIPLEQPHRFHLEHVAAVAAAPVRGINPVDSVAGQVGIDVTLSPCMPGGLPPPHDRLSLSYSWNSLCVLPTLRAACSSYFDCFSDRDFTAGHAYRGC